MPVDTYVVGGALFVSGNASTNFFTGSGSLTLTGSAGVQFAYAYGGSGTLVVSGVSDVTATGTILESFTWRVNQGARNFQEFTWAVGDRPLSFFRVTGKCKPPTCPPFSLPNCSNNVSYVVNILAHNVNEVCLKLRQQNFTFPIQSIQQFSNPAVPGDFTSSDNPNCDMLIDVTPNFQNADCVSLLVDVNVVETIGAYCTSLATFSYLPVGGFGLTGEAIFTTQGYLFTPQGGLLAHGIGANTSVYVFAGSGSLLTSGSSSDVALSAWFYAGGGELFVTGLATTKLVLSAWSQVATGGPTLTGMADVVVHAGFGGSGAVTTGQSSAFGVGDYLPFLFSASGAFKLSGISSIVFNYQQGTGGPRLGGQAGFKASNYTIFAAGGLTASGALPGIFFAIGGLTLNGTAMVVFGPNQLAMGRLGLGGAATAELPYFNGTGSLSLSGVATAVCSNQGTIVMGTIGAYQVTAEEALITPFVPAPVATAPSTQVTTSCCAFSLPLALVVTHGLGNLDYFARFLQRNNQTVASTIVVSYDLQEQAWFGMLTYVGTAPAPLDAQLENWYLHFGFRCLTDFDGTNLSMPLWQFSVLVMTYVPGYYRKVSRIVCDFAPSTVCPNGTSLNFSFVLNTVMQTTTPSTAQAAVVTDDVGLFIGQTFLNNPQLSFNVSSAAVDNVSEYAYLGPALAASQQQGSNLG